MKQPKKLTRGLKEAVSACGLNPDNWMLLNDGGGVFVTIIHKESGKTKIIDKYAKKKGGRGI